MRKQEHFILQQFRKWKISFLLPLGNANFGRLKCFEIHFQKRIFFSVIIHTQQVTCKRILATSFGLEIKPSSGH